MEEARLVVINEGDDDFKFALASKVIATGARVQIHNHTPSMIVTADEETWTVLTDTGGLLDNPAVEVVENEPISYPKPVKGE